MKRTRLKRRGGLGRTAEQLAWLAGGLAQSGSRIEDHYWETQLARLIDETLADALLEGVEGVSDGVLVLPTLLDDELLGELCAA